MKRKLDRDQFIRKKTKEYMRKDICKDRAYELAEGDWKRLQKALIK